MTVWKVYTSEGAYTGDVAQAPTRDVQVVVQSDPAHGWQALSGSDYYVWRDGRWFGVDLFGLFDYLITPGWKRVLMGRTLTREEFNAVWQRAMADPELPPKTGFHKRERRPE